MDEANLTAAWLSFAATAVGLGGLISQASAINDQLDPYHATRTQEYLGIWFQRQARFPWWKIAKPPPLGPVLAARMSDGFCGVNLLHITRIPLTPPGKVGWSILLAMFNHETPALQPGGTGTENRDGDIAEKGRASQASTASSNGADDSSYSANWAGLERTSLKRHQEHACITISRTTLITMLVVTNGRSVFQYSDATGFRAGYASYCGQWYITWPIGQEAIVKFAAHDSIGSTEVLPRSFPVRVDRCGQIVSGVVCSPTSDFAVGFCGRKPAGTYRLEHAVKGFQGAHSGRHLYNMMGGKAFQVDFMTARRVVAEPQGQAQTQAQTQTGAADSANESEPSESTDLTLHLPSKDDKTALTVHLQVPAHEESILQHALDTLPWTNLSWSAHRGLRDILLAYAKPITDLHRTQLASILQTTVAQNAAALRARGWDPAFVRENMGPMAASAVLSGGGNSGDSVRVVADLAALHVGAGVGWDDVARLDEVRFWRGFDRRALREVRLDAQGVVALTKVVVLEWSQEFDYQLYHHLPISMYFG
ncbi:hypothetical protein GGR54DRAFT_594451 [Hypoxylon sp. NC1633]|nr:hypothetical protein GGR54DRAFT_594451 [Hypoxylon sp. NC1633]